MKQQEEISWSTEICSCQYTDAVQFFSSFLLQLMRLSSELVHCIISQADVRKIFLGKMKEFFVNKFMDLGIENNSVFKQSCNLLEKLGVLETPGLPVRFQNSNFIQLWLTYQRNRPGNAYYWMNIIIVL